jgi:hypothetical protein
MKCLKWIAVSALSLSCITVTAGNIPATVINDNYIGAGYTGDVKGDENIYDISQMEVSRTGTQMTVDIFTNFVGNNDDYGIVFGDLFMSTNVTNFDSPWKPNSANDTWNNTNWNYAYTIADWQASNWSHNDRNNTSNGYGRLVSGFDSTDLQYSNNSTNRHNQGVALKNSTYIGNYQSTNAYDTIHSGGNDYDADSAYLQSHWNQWTAGNGKISFTFDVANTALATANQIAFRWAMSCANDIIEGLVSVRDPDNQTTVPEPQTLLLMLLGMAGIAYRRKNNA